MSPACGSCVRFANKVPAHHCRRYRSTGSKPRVILVRALRAEQPAPQLLIQEAPNSHREEQPSYSGFLTPLAVVLVLASGAAVALKTLIKDDKTLQAEYGEYYLLPNPEADPEAYKRAVARSKQATLIHRAVAHMKLGEPVRAVVEIERALQANAVCRSPLLCGSHTADELQALYLLYIKNSEVPSNFAVLLQLRVLLGISPKDAEALEREVLYTGEAFSI